MYPANYPKEMRYQIFPKAFETATLSDGFFVSDIDGKKQPRKKILRKRTTTCQAFANLEKIWNS